MSRLEENADYASINGTTARFSSAPWFAIIKNLDLTVCGTGGIGSWLVLLLGRLFPKSLLLYDPDVVDAVNMAGQFFSIDQIGQQKVLAIARALFKYANYYHTNTSEISCTSDTDVYPIVFTGFDNMSARKDIYTAWKRKLENAEDKESFLLIDGRLSAESLQIFCMTGTDDYYMEQYEKEWLFSDAEAEQGVCSYKQTSYCANLIASLMTNLFINWCANKTGSFRALPFKTEYSADQMFLSLEV